MNKRGGIKYQNNQLWCECQLVSLWNAFRFFGKEPPIIGTGEYCIACIDARSIYGAAINITRERKRLGMVFVLGKYKLKWIRKNLPVHLCLFTKHRGYHSVLIVEVKKNMLLLANYTRGRLQWLSWNSIKKMLTNRKDVHTIYSYKLKEANK